MSASSQVLVLVIALVIVKIVVVILLLLDDLFSGLVSVGADEQFPRVPLNRRGIWQGATLTDGTAECIHRIVVTMAGAGT
jgi:hypothetical protein